MCRGSTQSLDPCTLVCCAHHASDGIKNDTQTTFRARAVACVFVLLQTLEGQFLPCLIRLVERNRAGSHITRTNGMPAERHAAVSISQRCQAAMQSSDVTNVASLLISDTPINASWDSKAESCRPAFCRQYRPPLPGFWSHVCSLSLCKRRRSRPCPRRCHLTMRESHFGSRRCIRGHLRW